MKKDKEINTRNRYMQICLTEEEYEAIDRIFKNYCIRSRGVFIRAISLKGSYGMSPQMWLDGNTFNLSILDKALKTCYTIIKKGRDISGRSRKDQLSV